MTDETKAKIDQAISDKNTADSARGDVVKQADVVHQADDLLTAKQTAALDAHNKALLSAHDAIDALTKEVES